MNDRTTPYTPGPMISAITGRVQGKPTAARDEPRIRHNLDRYHEAAETWRVLSHRAREARATMDDALACLRAAGGTKEAERLTDA